MSRYRQTTVIYHHPAHRNMADRYGLLHLRTLVHPFICNDFVEEAVLTPSGRLVVFGFHNPKGLHFQNGGPTPPVQYIPLPSGGLQYIATVSDWQVEQLDASGNVVMILDREDYLVGNYWLALKP
jgi:hypothetical protein